MGQQHEVAEAHLAAARFHRERHAAQVGQPLLVLAAQGQGHQTGAGRQHVVAELARQFVAEAGGAHAGDRQAAGGDHQRGRREAAQAGVQPEHAVGLFDLLHAAAGLDAHAGGQAFVDQHLHDQLGRDIAEQLAQFLLVVGDAVALDHVDEVAGRVARQRRFAEMRIGRQEVGRRGAGVGEVAASAARHQDLLADLVGVLDDQHAQATLTGRERGHETRRAAADHQDVVGGGHALRRPVRALSGGSRE